MTLQSVRSDVADDFARPPENDVPTGRHQHFFDDVYDLFAQGIVNGQGHIKAALEDIPDESVVARRHLQALSCQFEDDRLKIRDLLSATAPSPLGGRTLEGAIRTKLNEIERLHRLATHLITAGPTIAIDKALAHDIFHIAREAIHNVAQHANASMIRVGIVYAPDSVSLLIEDDGCGFSLENGDADSQLGIRRMKERAFERGASISVTSVEGWGTTVRASFPIRRDTSASSERITIMIVEPRPALRAGLSALLTRTDPSISIAGEMPDGPAALDALHALAPNLVVIGLGLQQQALTLIKALKEKLANVAVVVVSTPFTTQELVEEAFTAGADACVDAGADAAALRHAVNAAFSGNSALTSLLRVRPDLRRSDVVALTSREREVRTLIEAGMSDRAIAQQLMISVKTVEKHVSAVLRKAGVKNRMQLLIERRIDPQNNVLAMNAVTTLH